MAPSSRSRSTSDCTKWPRPPSTRAAPTVGLTRRRWALVGLMASAHLVCAATPREAADYLAGSDRTALEALAAGADVVATAESRPGKGPYACRASALVQEVWAAGGLPSLYSAGAWYFICGFSTNADHHGGGLDFCHVQSGRQSQGGTLGTWSTRGTPSLGRVLAARPFPVHSTNNPTLLAEDLWRALLGRAKLPVCWGDGGPRVVDGPADGSYPSAGCFRVRPTRDHVREAKGAHSKGVHSTREERMACRRPGVSAESLPERRECRRVTPGRGWQTRTRARSITKRPQLQAMPPTRVVEEDLGLERFRGRSGTRACPLGGSMLARGASEARALGAVAGRSPGGGDGGDQTTGFSRGSEAPRRRDTPRAVPGGWGTAQGGASDLKTSKSILS